VFLIDDGGMSGDFPEPTHPAGSGAEVFIGYLDYFRARMITKVEQFSETDRCASYLPSGWTPLELIKHCTFVELRWLEWGFAGSRVDDPWGDEHDGRWRVSSNETIADLVTNLRAQAARSQAIIETNDLSTTGQPGPRWDGAEPATLERILFHLIQEYARHLGQLDVVAELVNGNTGE
jgi:uncharacterized damage-inducible protein DinB